jgi:WD40 repeat protein
MSRSRLPWLLLSALSALGFAACSAETERKVEEPSAAAEDCGPPLYVCDEMPEEFTPCRYAGTDDPIVVPDCRLSALRTQDVPSQRDGVLLVVGTETGPGETVAADRLTVVNVAGTRRRFRRLCEDDRVEAGQLLAWVDDRLALDETMVKNRKLGASKADLNASEKTSAEAMVRHERQTRLLSQRATSEEETAAAALLVERYAAEVVMKRESVGVAEGERNQADTVLEMHQVRAGIGGVVKAIHKKPGEAVHNLETVLQIHDPSRLKVEGLLGVQHARRLHKGMRVTLEPSRTERPVQTLLGHLREVTAVTTADGPDGILILSADEEGTVRVWDRERRAERAVFRHPGPVKTVACTPLTSPRRLCLTGCGDGVGRLWDLDAPETPPLPLEGGHQGPITCVAVSPDGASCATGGEDRAICIWDVVSGALRYRLPEGHRGAVTSLSFTPRSELISAGADNALRTWQLGTRGARPAVVIDSRGGDVAQPGVSRDGRFVLLDQGKALRLLRLDGQRTEAVLDYPGDAGRFTTFAQFSPDSRLILTAGDSDGLLRLWRSPTADRRPHELAQLAPPDDAVVTCAAFARDGSFLVTGSRSGQVLVWPLPDRAEVERRRTAEVTLLEPALESSTPQVRIWAEADNTDGVLLPGGAATLTAYPQ